MRLRAMVFVLVAFLGVPMLASGEQNAGKNQVFVWGGACDLFDEMSTAIYGASYGRYLTRWLMLEAGVEGYSGDVSGTWSRINALFEIPTGSRLAAYAIAGTSSFYPDLGAGAKIRFASRVGIRLEYTRAYDDDEGWYGNIRGGVTLSF
ncbi:MAG: hypothetical protein AB1714_23880 [Acidobacteriota bacterium]